MARNQVRTLHRKRPRIHEITAENDIRYRGPLSYRHFQILGWLCIALSQAALLMRLGAGVDKSFAELAASAGPMLQSLGSLSLPLLLIANFAQILDSRDGYIRQTLTHGAAVVLIWLLFMGLYSRYMVGTVGAFLAQPAQAESILSMLLRLISGAGFISFNIFVDLFLCSLFMLFLNYRPRRFFTGKRLILFRLLALLPIAYELVSMILKVQASRGVLELPVALFPLLTMKPPMTFVLFVVLALFVKIREKRFRRRGKTREEYDAFLKTRKNSWNFSVFLAVMMVVLGTVDYVISMGYSYFRTVERYINEVGLVEEAQEAPEGEEDLGLPGAPDAGAAETAAETLPAEAAAEEMEDLTDEEFDAIFGGLIQEMIEKERRTTSALGLGGSVSLIALAPLVLLFSYTRTDKNKMLGLLIPVGGIALILLLYLEAGYQLLRVLPLPKLDLNDLMG